MPASSAIVLSLLAGCLINTEIDVTILNETGSDHEVAVNVSFERLTDVLVLHEGSFSVAAGESVSLGGIERPPDCGPGLMVVAVHLDNGTAVRATDEWPDDGCGKQLIWIHLYADGVEVVFGYGD